MVSDKTPLEPEIAVQMGTRDSLAGFNGCERATWSPQTTRREEFIYQYHTVVVTRDPNTSGEKITVKKRDGGQSDFVIPMPENGHFNGVAGSKLFVDAGTGPDDRHLYIYDINKKLQFYDTPYCGELRVLQTDRLYFLLPVTEEQVTKMPDCPEKEQWEKDGLKVGYGQRCIFNLKERSLTRKSEWACVPMQ